jgi:cellulose synthase operon protein C
MPRLPLSGLTVPRRAPALLLPVMLSAVLALTGCEDSKERAERYYKSGMELLAAGDPDRAILEFRNVFKYDGFHKEARQAYADTLLAQGNTGDAYSQYLRLIEQYPDTSEVRRTLAEIAIGRGDWAEAERHGRAALALTPDDPAVQAIGAALDYRAALLANDPEATARAVGAAQAVLDRDPANEVALRVMIDHLSGGPDPLAALPVLDRVLAENPTSLEFQVARFRLLAQANDTEGTGTQLRKMYELFPDNQQVRAALIGWYLTKGDLDGAEAFLRQLAGDPAADTDGNIAVVQFLQRTRSPEAAAAELDRLIAASAGSPGSDLYRALRATLDFEGGRQDAAIAAVEEIVKTAPASDQTRKIKITLAQMLSVSGNAVGARARIEEVLTEDPTNVEALKMRAAWLVEEDKPGDAIVDLRAALDQAPRDAAILTLMAQAHERDGSPELAGERLALAVEVSGSAPDEALRYARFLLRDGRTDPAIAILVDANRSNPGNMAILSLLAELYLGASDWARAQDTADQMRAIGTPEADSTAQKVQAALLLGQNRTDDGIAFLEGLVSAGDTDATTVAMILQTRLRAGKTAEARSYLDDQIARAPDNPQLQLLSASLYAVSGDAAKAETIFRSLMAQNPAAEAPARMLYGLLSGQDRREDATAVLDAALAAQPASGTLRWIKAGELERAGDIDGAIAVYEALYAEDSNNPVIANNLASLITAHRDDPESLERGFTIARRLRGLGVPAFQDTYGWISYRRGDLAEALANLEPAAAGLPNDPLVQYHLGMTYVALERPEDAAAALRRALKIAGDNPLPQFQTARDTLAKLGVPEPAAPDGAASGQTPAPGPVTP